MASKRRRFKERKLDGDGRTENTAPLPVEHKPAPVAIEIELQDPNATVVILPEDPRDDRRYPLWDKAELQRDIERALANIEKFEAAIAAEQAVIVERREQQALCDERDRKLEQYENEVAELKGQHGDEEIEKALRHSKTLKH